MRKFIFVLILTGGTQIVLAGYQVKDSVGLVQDKGQTFILHQVTHQETLYSLAKRYKVKVSDILQVNPEAANGLKIGDNLKIPVKGSYFSEESTNMHRVKKSETLYSISQKYQISVEQIKQWNNLTGNALAEGQQLVVADPQKHTPIQEKLISSSQAKSIHQNYRIHLVKEKETLFSIAQTYQVSVSEIKKWNRMRDNSLNPGQKLIIGVGEKDNSTLDTSKPLVAETTIKVTKKESETPDLVILDPDQIVEEGLAEVIDQYSDTRKYLALHRTAPVGTIIQIKNEMNDMRVFVRVVGNLPDTGNNEKLLIKISKAAYKRLGAIDARFLVVLSYVL